MMKKNYNKKTKFKFLFLALLCLVSFNSYSTDWYVDGSVGASGVGTSWGTAFKTIQEAVDATAGGTTSNNIFVKEGIYTGATTAVAYGPTNKFISMFGGYDSVDATLDVVNNPTIIDGQNSIVGVWARNLFTLDGFTVRNGYRLQTAGSGVMSFSASNRPLTIRNCIIENNQVAVGSSSSSDVKGGGVFANACEIIIENSTIQNNVARTSTGAINVVSALGGGIYGENTITITNSTISGNEARSYQAVSTVFGGGIYTTGQAVNVTGSTLTGNFTNYQNGGTIVNREFANANVTFNGTNTLKEFIVDATSTVTLPAGNNTVNVTGNFNNSGTVTANAGSSITVAGTSTGNITYNVNVSNVNWHLVTSPVSGAQYNNTWVTDNEIHISGSNRGISTYDNATPDPTTGQWNYYQGGTTLLDFESGVGYSLKKAVAAADFNYSFTGAIPTAVNPAISQDDNNWNLIGNSFPSYMDVAAFITANGTSGTDKLSGAFQSIYVWNGTTYSILTTGHIQPGQAFFVNSKVGTPGTPDNVAITKAMQSHQDPSTSMFLKSSTPSLSLSVSNGKTTKNTEINYLDAQTKGLDPGFDIGMFDGVASELSIYTHLVDNNEGISFGRQALPTSEMESAIIPLGVKAIANKEITFSLSALNLPSGVNVYLENREENTFTSLTNGDIKITPQKNIDGVGIYYVRVSSKALSTETINLEGVSIYKMNNNTLRINGLSNAKASVKMFTILGKQVLNTSFEAKGNNEISLPRLATGVYIVQLQSEQGNLNKKIILE